MSIVPVNRKEGSFEFPSVRQLVCPLPPFFGYVPAMVDRNVSNERKTFSLQTLQKESKYVLPSLPIHTDAMTRRVLQSGHEKNIALPCIYATS